MVAPPDCRGLTQPREGGLVGCLLGGGGDEAGTSTCAILREIFRAIPDIKSFPAWDPSLILSFCLSLLYPQCHAAPSHHVALPACLLERQASIQRCLCCCVAPPWLPILCCCHCKAEFRIFRFGLLGEGCCKTGRLRFGGVLHPSYIRLTSVLHPSYIRLTSVLHASYMRLTSVLENLRRGVLENLRRGVLENLRRGVLENLRRGVLDYLRRGLLH